MGLLQPDSGLLFWMTLAFLAVFLLLAKYGFPIIIRSVEERKAYIDTSLQQAAEAEERVRNIEREEARLKAEAERERTEMLREAISRREELLAEARNEAEREGERIRKRTIEEAEREREMILKDARNQVAMLALSLTERMLRHEVSEESLRMRLDEHLIDEIETQAGGKA